VVDAEDRVHGEDGVDDLVEFACRLARSWPNGFSMTTRRQAPSGSGETVLLQLLDHIAEELRWDRQVEGVVAAGAAGDRRVLRRLAKRVEGGVVVEVPGTNRKPSASCAQTSSRNGVRRAP
jgi:hypothetical protein